MITRNLKHTFVGFLLLCFAVTSFAAVLSPVVQLETVSNRLIADLKANQSRLHKLSVVRSIVRKAFMPNVDLDRMAATVVGRPWRGIPASQRAQFKQEFASYVTTTYAAALSSYNDDRVEFRPLRTPYVGLQTVQVDSRIVRKSGQHISVTYYLTRAGDRWKVYDFSIEGVSMMQSYHAQFADILANQGMPALLQRLHAYNARTHE